MSRLLSVLSFLFFSAVGFADELPDFKMGQEPAKAYFKKGTLQLNNHQYSAARESFLSSLSVMEDFHLARKMLSDAYYLGGEWQESLNELEILERRGKINPIWKNRAEILRLGISGSAKKDGLTFFRHISGDDHRGFRFKNPTDALVDTEGNLYILSYGTSNIVKFDPNGLPVGNYKGGFGRTFDKPLFFVLHKDTLYVSDFGADMIYKISEKGRFLERFGEHGLGAGQFHGPSGLDVSGSNYLYVSDSGNNRIQKFSLDGKFIQEFGKSSAPGQTKLNFPAGLCIGEKGEIYVADKGNRRIAVFDEEGNFLKEFTHPNMKMPRSVKFFKGRMYVSDELFGLLVYNPATEKWTKISSYRDSSGDYVKMLRPFSSTADYTGSLYTVDYSKHKINVFSPRNSLTSNLNVFVERAELANFPTISFFVRIKNRNNQDLGGIRREAFRVTENSNVHPLVGLANMKEFNDKISVSLVFENSPKVHEVTDNLNSFLGNFFSSFTKKDRIEVIRAGKDSEKVYDFGRSPLDVYARIRKSTPEKNNINLGKSLYQGISDLTPELGPRAVILLVSGDSLSNAFNQYSLQRNIQFAVSHSIPVYVLALNAETEMAEMYKDLAERTGGRFIRVPGAKEENQLYNMIRSAKDKRYIISFKSKVNHDLAGRYIDFEVSVLYKDITGKAQGGYFVPEQR